MRAKEVLDLLRISAPQGAAMLVRSLPVKIRRRVARDVFATFATHAGIFNHVTDADRMLATKRQHTQSGRVFQTFKR